MSGMVNGKHLNIDLDFRANTAQATKEVQALQGQLNKLLDSLAGSSGEFGKNLGSATSAAIELKRHLSAAVDVNTGKLDLNNFSKSLTTAGKDLNYFREKLTAAGPEGQKAFRALTNSIYSAEAPLKRTNALVQEFATTLKNTARWQISSSILHGFMGSIQSAFHYAEDLNESLNNIRIVTGQNTDQMANFAAQANKAAKELSTTTTKYTDAALIYYQQGLSDKEVKERTDTTIKMANVARESAEEVSNQMTAVWNNFNKDGSQAVESFADKMTALGAATASSTSEIAEGLSKFSGIADTIGLSFDYATSALATITATSRESADVVGTALKTIFGRMEGLKLNNVTEDGTDLNKYSEALAKIGVSIKDEQGQLRTMDDILSDMGDKWQGLNQAQKVATAQTVAGVRQYNQLITLMDNWDFFQTNLSTAQGAEGTLQKQADIYAESWEAAQKRVQASMEKVYSQLLNDDFFIDLNNGLSDFIDLISNTIKGLGGLKGVLSGLGVLATKIFGKQLSDSINNLFDTPKKRLERWRAMQEEALLQDELATPEGSETRGYYENLTDITSQLVANEKELTAQQKEQLKLEIEQYRLRIQKLEVLEQEKNKAEVIAKRATKEREKIEDSKDFSSTENQRKVIRREKINGEGAIEKRKQFDEADADIRKLISNSKVLNENKILNSKEYEKLDKLLEGTGAERRKYIKDLIKEEEWTRKLVHAQEEEAKANDKVMETDAVMQAAMEDAEKEHKRMKSKTDPNDPNFNKNWEDGKEDKDSDKEPKKPQKNIGDAFVNTAQAISSVTMAMQSLVGIWDIWNDEDMSAGEKAISTMTTLGMVIPGVIGGLQGIQGAIKAVTGAEIGMAAAAPYLLAIAAAITAISFGVSALVDWWNKDATAAKEANEAVKGLTEEYNNLKTANEELKKSFEDYNSARTSIQNMVAGTQEWKDAVVELNDQVIELIDKYPELGDKVKKVNGIYEISGDVQDEILKIQEERLDKTALAKAGSEMHADFANSQSAKTDFYRDELGGSDRTFWNNVGTGALMTSMPLLAPLTIGDQVQNGIEEDQFNTVIDQLVDAYDAQGNLVLDNTSALVKNYGISENLANKLVENKDETKSLVEELSKNKKDANEKSKEMVDKLYDDKAITQISADQKDSFKAYAGGVLQSLQEQKEEEYKDKGIWGGKDDEDIQQEYAKAMGYEWKDDLDKDKGLYEVNGEEKTIDDKTARSFLATKEAMDELGKSTANLEKTFNDTVDKIKTSSGMSESGSGHLLGLLQGTETVDDLTADEIKELKDKGTKGIEEIYSTYDEDSRKALRIDKSKEDAIEDLNNLNFDFSTVTQNMSSSVQKAFQEINFESDGITAGAAKTISNTLNDAFLKSDLDSTILNTFTDMYKEAGDKSADFIDAFNNIQWNTATVESFKDTMSKAGLSFKETDLEIHHLIESLDSTEVNMTSVNESFAKFNEIAGKLNFGDTISNDQFEEMKKSMGEAAGLADCYFVQMLDGTHKLIGSAQDFRNTVKEYNIEQATKVKIDKENQLKDIQEIKNMNESDFNKIKQGTNQRSIGGIGRAGDEELIRMQAKIVNAQGSEEERKIANRTFDSLKNGDFKSFRDGDETSKLLGKLNESFKAHTDNLNDLNDVEKTVNQELRSTMNQIALSASNMTELKGLLEDGKIDKSAYDFASLQMHEEERREGIDSQKISDYGTHLQGLAEMGGEKLGDQAIDDSLATNSKMAQELAIQVERLNAGVESLSSNWENWSSILQKSSKGSEEYFQAANGTREALADLFDVSKDYISLDFVDSLASSKKGLELMNKAAKGDGEAIDELRKKASEDIILKVKSEIDLKNFGEDNFDNLIKDLQKEIPSLKVGAELDNENLINSLNEMIEETGMSADQVNTLLSGIGFTTTFASQDENMTVTTPVITKRHFRENIQYDEFHNQIGWIETETVESVNEGTNMSVPSFAMASAIPGAQPKAPKIESLHRKGNGSANNGSRANTGGKKGKSGNGGGGKGNKNQKVQPKQYQDEFDVYGELNHAIKDLDHTLNQLGKEYDYVFGKERIKNLEEQNKAIQKQASYVSQLIKAEKKNQNKLISHKVKDKKTGKIKETGLKHYGAKFDEKGELLNYKDVTTKQWKIWNKARIKYNKSKRTDKDKKKFDEVDKKYEKFKKLLGDYESLHEKIQEDIEKQKELTRQLVENNFERWKLELEIELDTRKAKREWKDFVTKMKSFTKDFGKQFSSSFDIKVKTNSKNFDSLNKDLNALIEKRQQLASIATKEGYKEYAKKHPIDKNGNTDRIASSYSEAKEKMKELDEQIMETTDSIEELLNNEWELLIERLNQTQEELDLVNERLERQGDILAYNKQLLEMQYGDNIYGEKAYEQMQSYYQAENMYLQQRASDLKEESKYWDSEFKAAAKAARARGDKIDENDISTWSQDMVLAWKNAQKAAGDYEQTNLEIVKLQKEIAETAINKAIYDAQVATYGMEFEDYVDQWERAKEIQNRYLDDTEKLYHIETLMNKVDQQIASTTNAKNLERLRKFRDEELKKLSEEANLTKYMVEAANARYEIALKEMALEDAKNNKKSMKLARNEQGNWSYQYVANMDEVLKKQQELRDAQYNLHELAKKEDQEMENEAMNAQKRYWEETRKAAILALTDQEKGAKALLKATKELNEDLEYTNRLIKESQVDIVSADVSMAVSTQKQNPDDLSQISPEEKDIANNTINLFGTETNLQDIYTAFNGYGKEAAKSFLNGFTGKDGEDGTNIFESIKKTAEETFTTGDTSFVGIISKMKTDVSDYLTGKEGLINTFTTLNNTIDPNKEGSALQNYQAAVSGIFKKINSSIGGVIKKLGKKGYQGAVKKVNSKSKEDTKKIRKYIDEIYDKWKKAEKKVESYKKKVKKIKSKTITVTVKYKEVGKPSNLSGSNSGNSGSNSSGSNSSGNGNKPKTKDKYYIKATTKKGKKVVSKSAYPSNFKRSFNSRAEANQFLKEFSRAYTNGGMQFSIVKNAKPYKTGGYTGNWPSGGGVDKDGGRLAVLHQKELVLNKTDTKNILEAVNTIRDIQSLNSSITKTLSDSISNIFANSIKKAYGKELSKKQEEKEKSIIIENITAEFPNAENVSEIKEAIMSLPRLASQYVGRGKK